MVYLHKHFFGICLLLCRNILIVFNIHQGNSSYASFCTADNIQIVN
jgi:hypothetical protein